MHKRTKLIIFISIFVISLFTFWQIKENKLQNYKFAEATGGIIEKFSPMMGEIEPTGGYDLNVASRYNDLSDNNLAFVESTGGGSTTLSSTGTDAVYHIVDGGGLSGTQKSFIAWGENCNSNRACDMSVDRISDAAASEWSTMVDASGGGANLYALNWVIQMVEDGSGGVFLLRFNGDDFAGPTGSVILDHLDNSGVQTNLTSFSWHNSDMVTDGAGGVYVMTEMGSSPEGLANGHGKLFRYTSSGLAGGWPPGGVDISTNTTSNKGGADLVYDPNSGAVIAWADDEGGQEGIYAQRIDSTGTVLWDSRGELLYASTNLSSDYWTNSDFLRTKWRTTVDPGYIAFVDDSELKLIDFNSSGGRDWMCVQSAGTNFYDFDLMATAGDSYAVLVWEGDSSGDRGVYSQWYEAATGHSYWGASGALVDDAVSNGATNFDIFLRDSTSGGSGSPAYIEGLGTNVNASSVEDEEIGFGFAGGPRYVYSYNDGSDQDIYFSKPGKFFASDPQLDCFSPVPYAPTLVYPTDGAIVGTITPTLQTTYFHGAGTVGYTNYRITDTSAADCLAGANLVDSGTSSITSTGDENTSYQAVGLLDLTTYYWCAQNDDGTLQSAWTTMGEFDTDTSAPTLDYSTYLGGTGDDDRGHDLYADTDYVYVTGYTETSDFPTTTGAYSETFSGSADIFVSKIETAGNGMSDLIYSTFIGGSSTDRAYAIVVENDEAHITGYSSSSNYPTTTGAYQETYAGSTDAFYTILSDDGSSLLYSTFIGGSNDNDTIYDIVRDSGLTYLVGETESSNFPTTSGAYSETHFGSGGDDDVFVSIIDPSAGGSSDLIYSTFIGGTGYDRGRGIEVNSGLVYIAGYSNSSGYPTYSSGTVYDSTWNGDYDGFMSVFNPAGGGSSDLVYSSLIGGVDTDYIQDLELDPLTNDMYMVGYTQSDTTSDNFPTTSGAYMETKPASVADYDAFIIRFNPAGGGSSDLEYSTYFGGAEDTENTQEIELDPNTNEVYIIGRTSSNDLPVTADAYDSSQGGFYYDAFIAKLDLAGGGSSDLIYSTYLGGEDDDEWGWGISRNSNDLVYITGYTESNDYPTTPGAIDEVFNSNDDAYLTCFSFGTESCSGGGGTPPPPPPPAPNIRTIHGGGGSSAPAAPKKAPEPEKETPVMGPICGNGIVEDGEECDDGNILDGDGCSANCLLEELLPLPEIQIINIIQPTRNNGLVIDFKVLGLSAGTLNVLKHTQQEEEMSPIRSSLQQDTPVETKGPLSIGSTDYLPNIPTRIVIPKEDIKQILSFDYSRIFYQISIQQDELDPSRYNQIFRLAQTESTSPLRLHAISSDGEAETIVNLELDNFPPAVNIDTPAGHYKEGLNINISAN